MQKRLHRETQLLGPDTFLESETAQEWIVRKGEYVVQFTFPSTYPFRAPTLRILEPVGILPRAGICGCKDGTLCVSDFLSDWSPRFTVAMILERIEALFVSKQISHDKP
jgi:ubiquitin-protein ligase